MEWKDVAGAVGKAAPWIGSLLGGKAGEAAGNLVANILGVDHSPDAVSQALANDPGALVKLQEAQMKHAEELERISLQEKQAEFNAGIRHREIDTSDIQSARARDSQLRAGGYKNTRADIMILIAFIFLLGTIAMVWNKPEMPDAVMSLFSMCIGYVLKMLSDAFQFEFGSSRGSKEKDILMSGK